MTVGIIYCPCGSWVIALQMVRWHGSHVMILVSYVRGLRSCRAIDFGHARFARVFGRISACCTPFWAPHALGAALLIYACVFGADKAAFADSSTLIDVPSGCRISEGEDPYIGQVGPCQGKVVLDFETFRSVGSEMLNYWTHLGADGAGDESYVVKVNGIYYGMGDWYTGNITDMSYYFYRAPADMFEPSLDNTLRYLDNSIADWDTQNVKNMDRMFYRSEISDADIGDWDVSNVENMRFMFASTENYNEFLTIWDVSNVTNMDSMFNRAKSFNTWLIDWDVRNVTNMEDMFAYAESFNQPLYKWDVQQVEKMDYMFYNASSFDQDISSWKVRMIDDEPLFFDEGAPDSWTSSEKPDWDKWHPLDEMAPSVVSLFPSHKATAVAAGTSELVMRFDEEVEADKGTISIVDGLSGEVFAALDVKGDAVVIDDKEVTIMPPKAFSPGRTYMVLFDEGTFDDDAGNDVAAFTQADWPDTEADWSFETLADGCAVDLETQESFVGQVEPCDGKFVISPRDFYAVGSRYVGGDESYSHQLIAVDGTPTSYGPSSWYVANITDMSSYFRGNTSPSHSIDRWDVSNVTDMSYMFAENTQLTADFYKWDVSRVTNMEGMFYKTTWISLAELAHPWLGDSYWDTSSLTNTSKMFYEAIDFNDEIARWDMSGVTDTSQMFYGATSYNQDLGLWDMSNVTDASEMFRGASAFDQDLSEWDVDRVKDMSGMFRGASSFNSDIGDWYVREVTDMDSMFQDATVFDQDISIWNVGQIPDEPSSFDKNTSEDWTDEEKPRWGTSGDKVPPELWSRSPAAGAQDVDVATEFALYFTEDVVAGPGAIRIYEASGDQVAVIDPSSDAVEIYGATLVFTPSSPLAYDTDHYVLIDATAIEDVDRNAFAGISDPEAWAFTTVEDFDGPTLISTSPANGATGVDVETQLTLTFDEDVQAGTGTIDLYDSTTSTLMQSLAIDSADVAFEGTGVTLMPSNLLTYLTAYSVVIADGVILDRSDSRNAYAGLSGESTATSWRFTTEDAPVSAANSTVEADPSENVPVSDASTIWVTLRDSDGDPIGRLENLISGTTSHGEASVGAFTEQADQEGVYSAALTSRLGGEVEVTLTVGDTTLDATVAVGFVTVPEAPSDFVVIAGDGTLDLSWTAPFDGGADIEDYEYRLNEGDAYVSIGSAATGASVSVENGVPYAVTVRAVNAEGVGADSAVVSVPSVIVRSDAASPVESSFIVEVAFSEGVSGFDSSDLRLGNAIVGAITGSDGDSLYSFEVRPGAEGEVSVGLVANAVVNGDGWGNTAADLFSRHYDLTGPVFDEGALDSQGDLSLSVPENTTASFATLTADDAHGPVTYAMNGGDDAAHFAITQTGELRVDLTGGADFENPVDADGDNVYTFEIMALDAANPANTTVQGVKVTVTNVFEEGPFIIIEQEDEDTGASVDVSAQGLEIREGETAEVVLTLVEQPTAWVQVDVTSADVAVALIRIEDEGQSFDADATTLRFEPEDWESPQVVTVVGVYRDDLEDQETTIELDFSSSSDADYASVGALDFAVVSINTSEPGIEVSGADEVMQLDEGEIGTFDLWLTAIPSQELTLSVGSDNDFVATASPATLIFDAENWDRAQTVTVTGVEHSALSDQATDIRVTAPDDGAGFAGVEAYKTVQVTNTTVPSLDVTYPGSEEGENLSVEEGASTTFEFALAAEPTDTVEVKLSASNTQSIAVVATADQGDTLVFEPGDWDQPQTVTVTGVEDFNSISEVGLVVTLDPSGGGYSSGLDEAEVLVDVVDNDAPELLVSLSSLTISEAKTGVFNVQLETEPSGDVSVTLTSDDVEAVSLSSETGALEADGSLNLTFTSLNWNLAQTVTVTGEEDPDTRDEDDVHIQIIAKGHEYQDLSIDPVSVSVLDDDQAGLSISESELSISEGSEGSFEVVLLTEPSGDVTVTLAPDDVGAVSLSSTTGSAQEEGALVLTFARETWNVGQEVRVRGAADEDTQDESVLIEISAKGYEYEGLSVGALEVLIADSSERGFVISETELTVNEGAQSTFTLALATQPSGLVTVRVTSDDLGVASLAAETGAMQDDGSLELSFSSADWSVGQSVQVTGVEDDDADSETGLGLQFLASGAEYADLSGTLPLQVIDNDQVGLYLSETSLFMDEGEEGAFAVALTSKPRHDVVVTLTSQAASVATPDVEELTFTPDDWSQERTVGVQAGVDDDLERNRTTIEVAVSSTDDADYEGLDASVTVTVTDTTVAAILVDASGLNLTEGGTGSFGVSLSAEPSEGVSVEVSSGDTAIATVEEPVLSFNSANWFEPQTVTLNAPSDGNLSNDEVVITLSASGTGFNNVEPVEVPLTVMDNSETEVRVSATSLELIEGETASLFVTLGREPAADVVLSLSGADASLVTLSASELIFTTADWEDQREVVVSAVDNDDIVDGPVTLTLTLSSASSVDADYAGLEDQEVAVSISDDETVALVTDVSALSVAEGQVGSFNLQLSARPTSAVEIILGTDDTSVLRVSPTELTIAPADWDQAQRVEVTAMADAISEDTQVWVNLVAMSAEFAGVGHSVEATVSNQSPEAEDTGALVSSMATSGVMGTQMGNAINDAVAGGVGGGAGSLGAVAGGSRDGSQGSYDPEAYNRLHVLSARQSHRGFTLVDWYSLGLSQASLDAELTGEGAFAYALIGKELSKTASGVSGLLYGAETSSWDYENETDVDRTGFSVGYYAARRSGGLTFSGSAILTLSLNDFVSNEGATGDANSNRWILKGGVSGERAIGRRGAKLKPYMDLMYATETLGAFDFSDGTSSQESTANLGRLGLGLEYATAPSASGSRMLVRGELSQVFGSEDITLSDGTVYSPNEDAVGSVTFGWITRPGTDTTAQIELTFGELGNDEAEEIRLDGTVDRKF